MIKSLRNPLAMFFTISLLVYLPSAFGESSYEELIENAIFDLNRFNGKEHLSKPTFGISHDAGNILVYDGFILNNQTFTITDNFHTPFTEQTVRLGEVNSFETTVFAPNGLKVQEFLFGIPKVGEAHLSELGVEVWYNRNGDIEKIRTQKNSGIIDENTLVATHEKSKCKSTDLTENCDSTKISMIFLEPLKDKAMAIKAIDWNNKYQITYLNEGLDISDSSLNPMQTKLISSSIRNEGLLQVTQTAKYSPYWATNDGRVFERNSFGSFKQINYAFERFQDSGEPLTRTHSGFGGILESEKTKALKIFNAKLLLSKIPDAHSIDIKIGERISEEMKKSMQEQEQIAKKKLEAAQIQARFSNQIKY